MNNILREKWYYIFSIFKINVLCFNTTTFLSK